jgi:hypothetical protein
MTVGQMYRTATAAPLRVYFVADPVGARRECCRKSAFSQSEVERVFPIDHDLVDPTRVAREGDDTAHCIARRRAVSARTPGYGEQPAHFAGGSRVIANGPCALCLVRPAGADWVTGRGVRPPIGTACSRNRRPDEYCRKTSPSPKPLWTHASGTLHEGHSEWNRRVASKGADLRWRGGPTGPTSARGPGFHFPGTQQPAGP